MRSFPACLACPLSPSSLLPSNTPFRFRRKRNEGIPSDDGARYKKLIFLSAIIVHPATVDFYTDIDKNMLCIDIMILDNPTHLSYTVCDGRKHSMVHLHDWLTTPQIPFASKTTDTADHYLHDHDFFEIFYITKGSASHILNGERYTVQTGDLFYLNPEDAHCFLKDGDEYCAHRDIILRRSFFKEICDFISPVLYNNYTENKLNKILRLSDVKLKNFETVFEKLSALPAINGEIIMANARITLTELIGLLINSQSEAYFQRPIWLEKLLLRFNDPQLLKEGLNSIACGA